MTDLVIQNGHLIDPSQQIDAPRDLLIRDGRIEAIDKPQAFSAIEAQRIDATGLTITPGFIDIHVHLREPGQTWKETIATGTRAAAAGGFTTLVAMPNTTPVNDSVESLAWMLSPDRKPHIHLLAMPAATLGSLGQHLSDYEALARAGAAGFTDDGKPVLEDHVMRAALRAAALLGLPISQHAEDTRITGGCSMNAGPTAFRLGLRGMTVEAESNIVERDIRLLHELLANEGIRAHLHVQHVSTAKALEAIRRAKQAGLYVTCEAAPHHFTLTEAAVSAGGPNHDIAFDTHAKMNPPLRSEQDRQSVIAALLDGTVDCIATDHAPHAAHEKEVEFERAPNGITGLETALGLTLRILRQENGLPLTRIIELMSTHPAALLKLPHAGTLRPGSPADITLFNANQTWLYDATKTHSKSHNTPFDQTPMLGRIHTTLCAGKIVHTAGTPTSAHPPQAHPPAPPASSYGDGTRSG
jgi:dihydroorotase